MFATSWIDLIILTDLLVAFYNNKIIDILTYCDIQFKMYYFISTVYSVKTVYVVHHHSIHYQNFIRLWMINMTSDTEHMFIFIFLIKIFQYEMKI